MSDAADQANNNVMLGASLLSDVRGTPQDLMRHLKVKQHTSVIYEGT